MDQAAARPEIYGHDDLPDRAKQMIDDARAAVKADNGSALSAARKLIAVAVGAGVPMFSVAELRGLSFVYAHVSPPEARSTVESYAARAYQDVITTQGRLAELSSVETPLMRNNVEPAVAKAVAHALAHFEESEHEDAVQDDNDPAASATMSDHAPTIGGFQHKPVDPQAAAQAGAEAKQAHDEAEKSADEPKREEPEPKPELKSEPAPASLEPTRDEPKRDESETLPAAPTRDEQPDWVRDARPPEPDSAGVSYHDVGEHPGPGAATPLSGSLAPQSPAGLSTGDVRLP